MKKYSFEYCSRCGKETFHRVFKRFGKSHKCKGGGRFSLRRRVIWCLVCQKRRIENQRKMNPRKARIVSFAR